MAKQLILLSGIALCVVSSGAVRPRFSCGPSSGPQLRVRFDASVPTLTETSGTDPKVETILAPGEVCGRKFDFAKECRTNLVDEGNDFNYSFRCGAVWGDVLYLDRTGRAELRCMGEVPAKLQEPREYDRCRLD